MEVGGDSKRGEKERKQSIECDYGKLRKYDQWWRWNEVEEVLRDGKENTRQRDRGKAGGKWEK